MRVFKGKKDRVRVEAEATFDGVNESFILYFKPFPTSRTPDLMEDGLDHQIQLLKEFIIDWEIRDDAEELIPFSDSDLTEFLDILPYYVAARNALLVAVNPETAAKN